MIFSVTKWDFFFFFFLVQALASPSQRLNLQELFADIALEVDDRAQGETKDAEIVFFLVDCGVLACFLEFRIMVVSLWV